MGFIQSEHNLRNVLYLCRMERKRLGLDGRLISVTKTGMKPCHRKCISVSNDVNIKTQGTMHVNNVKLVLG